MTLGAGIPGRAGVAYIGTDMGDRSSSGWSRRAARVALWGLFMAIGLMQMAKLRWGWVTSYGADVICPALLYVISRDGQSLSRYLWMPKDKPNRIAVGIFLLSAAWEVAQRIGWLRGTFDAWDLLAYAIGVAVPWWLDRRFNLGAEPSVPAK